MEQENNVYERPVQVSTWGECVNQTQAEEKPYQLTFADPIYEMPHGDVYRHKKPKKKRTGVSGATVVLCVILALVVALGSSVATAWVVNQRWQMRFDNLTLNMHDKNAALQEQIYGIANGAGTTVQPEGTVSVGGYLTPSQVYAQNVDAVVAITSHVQKYDFYVESLGSGFIISEDGYVVSNYHVVEGAVRIEVTTSSNQVYEAVLVGYNSTNDIALLKVEAENLPYAVLGSSSDLLVGDQVAAIGNPLGELTSTLTVGYVSAKDRVFATDGSTINMIQTDAAINSGNSGGPLFNMKGEVVGITTAKYSGMSSSGASIEGIGFAIPMDDVIGMIEDLRELGYVSGAYLGVIVLDVLPLAQSYGLPVGAYVEEVTPGYAAEAAGLQVEDIIVELGGYEITSVSDLTRILRKFEPGETVSVVVYRDGQELQLRIMLDERPREVVPAQDAILMPGDEGFEEWYEEFIDEYYG